MAEYLIVAGMSGAGRSSAAATLEDMGWFVIDNLPPSLIGKVADLASHPGSELDRFCFVAGRGGLESMNELVPAIETLRSSGARVRVLFLDASDEVLVRRYEGSRRRHPLEADGVLESIRLERDLLRPIRESAEVVIDTSSVNVHQLRDRLQELFSSKESPGGMETSVVSFGFKHGLPLDVDLVLDCRFLPNPHWVEALRPHTGLDEDVREYVLERPEAQEFLARITDLLEFLLPAYAKEGKSYLSIAIGCTGGRHRSVAIAEELAKAIRAQGFAPTVHHRDIDR
ncbi:MAG: putative P-loop-containing kinase [Acidimicrobiaceae bacterium]|nr:putative P-loop-containing kinase [Acidimicrobiaceae bacterium]